jgi:hypothetical protein
MSWPISKAAWVRAAGEVIIDGIGDGSCNVLFMRGDDLGVVHVTEAQGIAAQAELDREIEVTDAMVDAYEDAQPGGKEYASMRRAQGATLYNTTLRQHRRNGIEAALKQQRKDVEAG